MQEPDSQSKPQPLLPDGSNLIDAIYEDGVIKPLTPLDLPAGTVLQLAINRRITVVATPLTEETVTPVVQIDGANSVPAADLRLSAVQARRRAVDWLLPIVGRLDVMLFAIGMLIYVITRFVALDRFPIYFFSDEAVQATLASDLLRDHFRDSSGTLLPPYFLNAYYWNLSLSVYIQLVSVALFGKSILITRGTSALVTILSAVAVSLMLKLVFKQRCWWIGALVVALLPAWFLHSRTAFETAISVSFYACFLCAYMLYRYRSPNYLYLVLLMGAATFYGYANGQGVMAVTALLLLLSDLRYHWSQRRNLRLMGGATLVLLLVIAPYIRFRYLHPDALESQLRQLSSYWYLPDPLSTKLATFAGNYLQGLSPGYWFFPNDVDLARHRMAGMGHLGLQFLPLAAIGLVVCMLHWRSSAHRTVLIAMLAVPFSPALVGIGITRVLFMIVPAALLICIGIEQVYTWLERRVAFVPFALGCCALLSALNLAMLRSALVDGPTWFTDYTLGGMQYGAKQLFEIIPQKLAQEPDIQIYLSPTWTNGTDVLPQFFLTPQQQRRVLLKNIDAFTTYKQPLSDNQLFIMPAYEYETARTSNKLVVKSPEEVVPYPNGTPGFYFVRMRYVDDIDAIFAQEEIERQKPVVDQATLDGQPVDISHSLLDIGQVSDLIDGDTHTLIRGMEANPLVIELHFPSPRAIKTVGIDTASVHFQLNVEATAPSGGNPRVFSQKYNSPTPDPHVDADLPGGAQQTSILRVEITDLDTAKGDIAHIHVRELSVR